MGEAECSLPRNSDVFSCEVEFVGVSPYGASVIYASPVTGDNVIFDFPSPYVSPLTGSTRLDLVESSELSNGNAYVRLLHPQGEVRGQLVLVIGS